MTRLMNFKANQQKIILWLRIDFAALPL